MPEKFSSTTPPATFSRSREEPFHCAGTSATGLVWWPQPGQPWSKSPCDEKWSVARVALALQYLPRTTVLRRRLLWLGLRPASGLAKYAVVSGRQWRAGRGPEKLHERPWMELGITRKSMTVNVRKIGSGWEPSPRFRCQCWHTS